MVAAPADDETLIDSKARTMSISGGDSRTRRCASRKETPSGRLAPWLQMGAGGSGCTIDPLAVADGGWNSLSAPGMQFFVHGDAYPAAAWLTAGLGDAQARHLAMSAANAPPTPLVQAPA
jgi:hypothetical protein